MSTNYEISVSILNNAETGDISVGEYGAEVAKEYADKAKDYAKEAFEYRNLAEAWAHSSLPPNVEGTRSSKTWADVARQWAESDTEPNDTPNAKSAKMWSDVSKENANKASASALASANSATSSANSATASRNSATSANVSETNAASSATSARQSAERATEKLEQLENVDLPLKADVNSPTLTGVPKAPTATKGTNTTQIATTAFVTTAVNGVIDSAPSTLNTLKKLASSIGNDANYSITVTNALVTKLDKTANAVSATKATQDASGNVITSTYATKATLKTNVDALNTSIASNTGRIAVIEETSLPLKANLASPTFTGTPKVPTAKSGTNTTQAASTAFVQAAISSLVASAPETLNTLNELSAALGNDPNFSTTITNLIGTKLDKTSNAVSATKATQDASGNVITSTYATKSDLTSNVNTLNISISGNTTRIATIENTSLPLKANLASPTFTGTPKAPTATKGTNTTQLATTAFVQAAVGALSSTTPEGLATLKDLAGALNNDPNFSTTITNLINTKLDKTANAVSATKATQDASGNVITTTYAKKTDVTASFSSLATVATSGKYTDLLNRPTIPSKTSQLTNDSKFVAQDANGNVTISGTLTASKVVNAYYNDYAEFFPRGEKTTVGDIIALGEGNKELYVKATDTSTLVVGVHSDEYAQIIGGETDENGAFNMEDVLQKYIPVALAGRVHVKFYGIAKAGVKVVPSDIPGVGRAFAEGDNPDNVVGIIVQGDDYQNVRKVKIMVRR